MDLNKFKRRIQIFDLIVILSFLLLAGLFFIFFFRKSQYINVKLKVTEKNILYAHSSPPSWFTYLFKKGMKETDGLGRTTAEVLDVYTYDVSPDNKAIYLTARLKTTYNSRSKEYKYKGVSVLIGEGLRINFDKVLLDGLVVAVGDMPSPYEEIDIIVRGEILNLEPVYAESNGVEPFIADAININDKVFDSAGRQIVEVIDKKVTPALKNTFDQKGNVLQRFEPRRKNVELLLKIKARKINQELYFLDDIRVKIGQNLPLHFATVSIYPVVTKFEQDTRLQ